ncbi:MAG: NAD(P)-binding domain-containing protein [Gemmataceae bacterium]|nr:NAD(P)-binding domain-containing protein [Gemmataceae bacterium]MCI0738746.1 NAD(P)-binding domain-containing protein [Gemmataceae bacterium]
MAPRPIIVIPGDEPSQVEGSPHLERLRAYGEVMLHTDRPADDEEKIRRCQGAVCLLNSRSAVKWPGHLLEKLPNLRMITVCGIGTDAVDLEAARRLGIVVSNVPARTAPIVAEHALALLLAVARQTWFQTDLLKRGGWAVPNNCYLRGKTLGVIGMGNIGREMARLGLAIGMKVQAWTMNPSPKREQEAGVPFVSLEDLMRTSDAVSVHLKLTEQSRGLLGRRELEMMKPGALLVNTARGPIVDMPALVDALNCGHVGGAGLDVFDIEPLPRDHPILKCQQVVLTPHVADQNEEGFEILNCGVVDNVIAFLEGNPINRVV